VIDAIVPEPAGGAQADHDAAAVLLAESLRSALDDVGGDDPTVRIRRRRAKFRDMGVFVA
jgi:acetyl-CoA carboxylase alpha subunit